MSTLTGHVVLECDGTPVAAYICVGTFLLIKHVAYLNSVSSRSIENNQSSKINKPDPDSIMSYHGECLILPGNCNLITQWTCYPTGHLKSYSSPMAGFEKSGTIRFLKFLIRKSLQLQMRRFSNAAVRLRR